MVEQKIHYDAGEVSKYWGFANLKTHEVLSSDESNEKHYGFNYIKLDDEQWKEMEKSGEDPWDWIDENVPAAGTIAKPRLEAIGDEEAAAIVSGWPFGDYLEKMKPEAQRDQTIARKAAAFLYATSVINSDEGDWNTYESEIAQCTGLKLADLKRLRAGIQRELENYEGVAEVDQYEEVGEWNYDVALYTDYLANTYNADEEAMEL